MGIFDDAWSNGVKLCWEATRQGITKPGRGKLLAELRGDSPQFFLHLSRYFSCPAIPQKIQPYIMILTTNFGEEPYFNIGELPEFR
jgi:hypothetical protein